ncbi:MAG: acetyl-CoA carboxylase biotin carboxylase subunit [Bacteroidota bacterium]|nr:acetyl-CoA carboxylase biotin carboxylase subunit [Bacteroidota bacterium]
MKFKNILIANRSEIALRVIRSAHEYGYNTIAIASPHDKTALYAREARECFQLSGNSPKESYLDIEQVLRIASKTKTEAIHPGYGFLSENAAFSEACTKSGIKFIGPTPESIDLLGDKTKARKLAAKLGIATPGGTTEALKDAAEAIAVGEELGYPILLKAAAGGGGKGMRVVESSSQVPEALNRAMSEALGAFGDDRVYIEKYISAPRHIEFQILADSHGNIVHLGERECSIQRRNQKLVEESPSVAITQATRNEMGEAAIDLIREARYEGAGTVEFLVDQNGRYYFLEVNTRLQVEHPVTEFVTGLDLVREQFRIAEGEKLGIRQKDVHARGHSIEVRIQAEDVWNEFMPSLGRITHVRHPGGAFVRNDSALYPGLVVSGYYDSLLAKLVVWDLDRSKAIKRMKRATEEMKIAGVSTTIPFARFVMENRLFQSGEISTKFIETEFTAEISRDLCDQYGNENAEAFLSVQSLLDERAKAMVFVS